MNRAVLKCIYSVFAQLLCFMEYIFFSEDNATSCNKNAEFSLIWFGGEYWWVEKTRNGLWYSLHYMLYHTVFDDLLSKVRCKQQESEDPVYIST